MACHNLCSTLTPPPKLRALLGLGLTYCPRPTQPVKLTVVNDLVKRFKRDIYTKMFFAHIESEWKPNQLFIRSSWEPTASDLPPEFRARVTYFIRRLRAKFTQQRVMSNLTPYQGRLLRLLKASDEFIVFPSDKNLGPVILERAEYIRRAHVDHLCDPRTYKQLTATEAADRISTIEGLLSDFLDNYAASLDYHDRVFLERSSTVDDPYAYFYLTAKVHKTPWTTRPIVSVCGSLLHGLGRWVDQQLQPICRQLPSYIKSSFEFRQELLTLPASLNLSQIRIFTCDATSMYTNIDTDHALSTIAFYLRTSRICRGLAVEPIIQALEIIMRNSIFKFGDTAWEQLEGTSMGAPPAPMYATLYFGIAELDNIPKFSEWLPFYRRYLDDCFGIWILPAKPDIESHDNEWTAFQNSMSYGKLTWIFSDLSTSVDFLDLTISILDNRIVTKIYEKPLNLYLYLPPQSAHPPGLARGMIIGGIGRIYRLTSEQSDRQASIRAFYRRLRVRGYTAETLHPLFSEGIARASRPTRHAPQAADEDEERIFLHLPFHPCNPSSQSIQRLFRDVLLSPPNEPLLPDLRNSNDAPVRINRMIVAYHRPYNLKNLLFPRRIKEVPAQLVSSVIPGPPASISQQALDDS
jgi:hypothetical protein